MVLAELGAKITKALSQLTPGTVVDEALINKVINSISVALLQSDVDVQTVKRLSDNVRKAASSEEVASLNKRRLIERAVVDELVAMVNPGTQPFQPKKGRCNVIMFVGLQGSGKTTTCSKVAFHWKRKGWKTSVFPHL